MSAAISGFLEIGHLEIAASVFNLLAKTCRLKPVMSLRANAMSAAISDLLEIGQPEIASSVFNLLAKTCWDYPFCHTA